MPLNLSDETKIKLLELREGFEHQCTVACAEAARKGDIIMEIEGERGREGGKKKIYGKVREIARNRWVRENQRD